MGVNPVNSDKAKKIPVKKIRFCFDESKSLSDWVALINDAENAPLGSYTHKLINSNINDPNLNFDEAQKILEKGQFKTKLLRMTDDVYLNPAQTTFTSIQRAMVIIGFQSMRNISLCLGIYNHMLELSQDEPLMKEIVLSFFTAILTARLAQRKAKILNCEPLVVAALTYSLGYICLQFFGGETAKLYNEQGDTSGTIAPQEEQEIVGFLLKDLAIELIKSWNLPPHAIAVHENVSQDNIAYCVLLAREVTQNLKKGWQDESAIASMKKIETYLNCTTHEATAIVMQTLERVLEEVALYGNDQLMTYIPMPAEEEDLSDETPNEALERAAPNASRIKATVQQLSILMSRRSLPSVSDVMNIGLEGIYNGVDFDRVLFALLSADRSLLNAKAILEKNKSDLMQNFHFQLNNPEGWLFQHILREKRAAWVGGQGEMVLRKYRNMDFNRRIGKGQFFVAPLILDNRAIGVYYADRQVTSRMLDTRSYDAFSELCATINETIELVRKHERQQK